MNAKISNVTKLSAVFAALVFACTPTPALAQHHGHGSHGGGSHGGGFHGPGSQGHFHGGGFRFGGGNSHNRGFGGGFNGSSSRGFFNGGSRGEFHGNASHALGGSHFGGGEGNFAAGGRNFGGGGFRSLGNGYFGERSSSTGIRSGRLQNGGAWSGSSHGFNSPGRPFSPRAFGGQRSTADYGHWNSFRNRGRASFTNVRGSSSSVRDRQWRTFGNRGNFAGGGGSRSGQWEGIRDAGFEKAGFIHWRGFDGRDRGFGGGSSFDADPFAFLSDLFGLALDFGSLATRGFDLFGLGLNLVGSAVAAADAGSGGYAGAYPTYGAAYPVYAPLVFNPVPCYSGPPFMPYPVAPVTCP